MPRSRNRGGLRAALLVCLLALPAYAAQPYHLVLEANPAAPFPYLGKFGTVDLHVYGGGVRADTMWLDGFSRNGSQTITVENPFGRMYTEVPLAQIASILRNMGADNPAAVEPPIEKPARGKVGGIDATRYRMVYGPTAWIDVWTTAAVPENPQLRGIVSRFVAGISPSTAAAWKKIPGTPVYVELNFRRFQKLPILKLKKLTLDDKGEEAALKTGLFYFKAPLLDALWK